jgi:hypothetical protein
LCRALPVAICRRKKTWNVAEASNQADSTSYWAMPSLLASVSDSCEHETIWSVNQFSDAQIQGNFHRPKSETFIKIGNAELDTPDWMPEENFSLQVWMWLFLLRGACYFFIKKFSPAEYRRTKCFSQVRQL